MSDPISAAVAAFSAALKSIVSLRNAVSSTVNLMDDRKIDLLKKSIRSIYFFQDGFQADIAKLLSKKGDRKAIAQSIRERLNASDSKVKQAVHILTDSTLAENLRLDIDEVSAIRAIADLKMGIRQHLRNLVSEIENGRLQRGAEKNIEKISSQISKICAEIKKIDRALEGKGLQQAKPANTSHMNRTNE
jgi:hypothetical protein